ncbi:MAG TPA: hypothetical protein VL971_09440 [Rhizomicrobium sp.]|nr:hypothetical protein [Rhizomicrobium sp.]
MNFVKLSILGAALAGMTLLSGCDLCGCSTDPDATPAGQPFTYNGNNWQVADMRGEGRLVITAVDPKLAGLGTEASARHAIAVMPEAEYRAAANGWFATTGRFCTPGPAEPLEGEDDDDSVHTGYQYHYSCWTPA